MCVLMPTHVLVLVLVLGHQVLVLVLVLESQVLDNNTEENGRKVENGLLKDPNAKYCVSYKRKN